MDVLDRVKYTRKVKLFDTSRSSGTGVIIRDFRNGDYIVAYDDCDGDDDKPQYSQFGISELALLETPSIEELLTHSNPILRSFAVKKFKEEM